jgi:cytoskeletal protein RodZ
MSMETNKPAGTPDRGKGYEQRDADVRSLLKLGVWLIVVVAISMVAMKWTYDYYQKVQTRGPMVSPLVENENVVPPKPQLQAEPRKDLQTYCSEESEKLNTYGWVDQNAGVVRLPIERAMALTLQRGLPIRPADQTTAAAAASELPADTTAVPPTRDFQGQCGYVMSQLEASKPKENEKE